MTNNRLEFYIASSFAPGGDTGKDLLTPRIFFSTMSRDQYVATL